MAIIRTTSRTEAQPELTAQVQVTFCLGRATRPAGLLAVPGAAVRGPAERAHWAAAQFKRLWGADSRFKSIDSHIFHLHLTSDKSDGHYFHKNLNLKLLKAVVHGYNLICSESA